MTTLSTDLPLPFPGWQHEPTVAMTAGDQSCHQCACCGTVVIVPAPSPGATGVHPQPDRTLTGRPCPACCSTAGWWRQDTPDGDSLAGWRFVGDTPGYPQNNDPSIGAS